MGRSGSSSIEMMLLLVVILFVYERTGMTVVAQNSPDQSARNPVNTTIGLVYGSRKTTVRGTPYFSYNGIPYATASRFQEPKPIARRDFATIAVTRPPLCPQWDQEKSRIQGKEEGCLHLSIFTRQPPGTTADVRTLPSPVLVVLVNDRFLAIPETSPDFFLDNQLVVVTVSYRVGVLGFLSTGDSYAPGNYGLLDLEMALEWIHANIQEFGGNPQHVTLLGHGAGAALVSHLLLNPRVTDMQMITGAITMSGSPLCPWAAPLTNPMNQTRLMAEALHCHDGEVHSMVECIRTQPWERIITKQKELYDRAPWSVPPLVAPVVDGGLRERATIPMEPLAALEWGNFTRQIPLISGVVTGEAAFLFTEMFQRELAEDVTQHPPSVIIEHMLPTVVKSVARFCNHADEIVALIRYFYFREIEPKNADGATQATIQVMSDLLYNECQQKWSSLYREKSGAEVYDYVFSYKGVHSTLDPLVEKLNGNSSNAIKMALRRSISHGDDLIYLFNNQLSSVDDREMQEEMTRMWSEFAKISSTPRPGWNSKQNYADFKNYLRIDRPSREERRYREEAISFLNYVMALSKTPEEESTNPHDVQEAEDQRYEMIMWILVGIAIFLFLAFIVAAVLFVRQKKKTTFVTR
uniref:Acetylcholinesterase n=1 Tax=Hemiscolopendra marginata TaxID=943146 RepID=A0A646QC28_9MYRI